MKVSIITPTFNSQATISDTVTSVLNQSYANIEHIIVDGASTDNTLDIIKSLGHAGPIVSERDKGIYDAMNKGVKMATGDVIGILNSDDYYSHAYAIEKVVKSFLKSGSDSVYGDLLYVDANDTDKVLRTWVAGRFNRRNFLKGWMPPHPTFFVKSQVYQRHGKFNLNLRSSADYELLLRLLFVHKISVDYVPGILVHMRAGGQSNRSIKARIAAHKEDYYAWKINGLSPRWYTLMMKPTRKIQQFLLKSRPNVEFPSLSSI